MSLLTDVPSSTPPDGHYQHHRDLANLIETGTWTPAVHFATSDGTRSWTPDATFTAGYWQRIGDRVTVELNLYGDLVVGTGSGALQITGLPFEVVDGLTTGSYPVGGVNFVGWDPASLVPLSLASMFAGVFREAPGTTQLAVYGNTDDGSYIRFGAQHLVDGVLSIYTCVTYQIEP